MRATWTSENGIVTAIWAAIANGQRGPTGGNRSTIRNATHASAISAITLVASHTAGSQAGTCIPIRPVSWRTVRTLTMPTSRADRKTVGNGTGVGVRVKL